MDVHKAYDEVSHSAILAIMRCVGLPERVCTFVHRFLTQRTFAIRVAGNATGTFNSKRGVPQGSVLAPLLFNLAMLPLGWALAAISDVYYIIYADDITAWSVHNDLQRQESALQEALNTADEWCRCIGLTLSTDKTLYMSVANSWGRRRLVNTPIQLTLSGRPLTPALQLRILGVVITANGSAKAWIREIKQQAHQVLHLIRRISSKAGGARTKIARLLVRAVLQPRLIYSAQFQHLTVRDWARLECINREAMRVVTGLPRCTPIPILQEEAQLNTIDELIYQRRQARELKPSFLPPAADLAAYMGNPVSVSPPSIVSLPPWDHRQLTDNKPIGRLRNPVPRPTSTFRRHIEEADAALPTGSLVAYTDASCTDTQVVTSIVVPGHQNLCVNRLYLLRAPVPSVSAELLAIRDATKLVSAASASSSSFTIIRTDSTSAIKELRKVIYSV
ncbi:hypothetical protein HPB52_018415 [Rhipicephalus sanguineus]|uniref:Reverse transcriptase domain-containing protein n=1 Tax=Rhipicephalus sanguineus TaxID=34632 RepID=A0A9D4SNQ4_RHISA|nr:hypothetical protein HPB52_018415 [Rhipicephalus sanguineus]